MAEKRYPDSPLGSASLAQAVTPHDTNLVASNDTYCRALYVGTGGNVTVNMADDLATAVTFTNVQDGQVLDIQAARVRSTGTTASNIVALF